MTNTARAVMYAVENLEIALATLESILGKGIAPTTENQFRIK